jgi:hypothetical protein
MRWREGEGGEEGRGKGKGRKPPRTSKIRGSSIVSNTASSGQGQRRGEAGKRERSKSSMDEERNKHRSRKCEIGSRLHYKQNGGKKAL